MIEGTRDHVRVAHSAGGNSRGAAIGRMPLVRSFLAAIRSVDSTVQPGFVVKTGTSDMNVVGPIWRCPIVAYGPGDSALDHTPNEHLSLDEYWRAVLVLEAMLGNFAGVTGPAPPF